MILVVIIGRNRTSESYFAENTTYVPEISVLPSIISRILESATHSDSVSNLGRNATVMLTYTERADLPADERPHLLVVVDTEEEFDWFAEPDSSQTAVTAIQSLHLAQDILDRFDIKPCYVVDYPIASQPASISVLKRFLESGRCEIGAHLHPWVNPPHREEICRSNMYPGNLSYELEYDKLACLTSKIRESFGVQPIVYKAGRYGFGENTAQILDSLDYQIDVSICPPFDYSDDGGPDFSDAWAAPYWFGARRQLLEIPVTGAFVGIGGSLSKHLHRAAGRLEKLRLRGVLSRLNVVDRLMLSPEGYSSEEHKKLTRFLVSRGVRTFTWNFHSPSVLPGMTMYTKDSQELSRFLESFYRFFEFFFDELGGVATTPIQLKAKLEHGK